MAKVQHDISSHPDTVIILKDPLTQFAIWEIEEFPPHPELPNLQPPEEKTPEDYDMWGNSLSTKSKKKKKTMREEAIQEQPPVLWFNTNTPEVGGNSLEPESYNATAEAIPVEAKAGSSHIRASGTFGNGVETVSDKDLAAPLGSNLDHSANNDAEPIGPTHMNSPTGSSKGLWEEDGIYFHVSSRHLMEASGHFRRMMSGGKWKEGIREENGFFYTKTKEWDNEAFLILMNVFHLRNSRVPSSVSLEMMAKIAILVDFYECWEAIDIYKTIWVQNLKSSQLVPVTYGRDLVMWICVTQVFGLHVEFKQATKVAMMQSKDTIQALELPIYPKIVGTYYIVIKSCLHTDRIKMRSNIRDPKHWRKLSHRYTACATNIVIWDTNAPRVNLSHLHVAPLY
jgi:hypothetical protein